MIKSIHSLLFLSLLFAACGSKTSPLVEANLSSYQVQPGDVSLTISTNASPADGVSDDELLFKGGPSVTGHYTTVSLIVSPNGKFSNDSTTILLPLDINGQAQVFVSSNTIGSSTVTATVGQVSVSATPYFGSAWPANITVNPDSTFLTSAFGVWTPVTVNLHRSLGKVSSGIQVSFHDSSGPTDPQRGIFQNTMLSDTAGNVQTAYWLQDTSYHGFVYIIATVDTVKGTVEGSNRIRFR